MKEGTVDMKNYINAKAEIYKLDAGDVMLYASIESFNLDSFESDDSTSSKHYSNWGNWNS